MAWAGSSLEAMFDDRYLPGAVFGGLGGGGGAVR